jgi:ketosteroid isomerase-like protein
LTCSVIWPIAGEREIRAIFGPPTAELVRKCFSAWETKDREALEELLAEDFTFTSPNDDHISKDEYWKKCWPGSEKIRAIRIDKLFEQGDEAFVRYECELKVALDFGTPSISGLKGTKSRKSKSTSDRLYRTTRKTRTRAHLKASK